MKYRLLGPLEIGPAPSLIIGSARQRTLLAMLLLDVNRTVASSDVITGLWPQRPETLRNNLHAQVARLRQTLPDTPIRRRPGGYLIEIDPDEIDITHFHQMRETAGDMAADDPHGAIAVYRKALSLWRGNALQDANLGERCKAAAASLHETRLHTVEQLAKLHIEHEDPGKIVNSLMELVRLNPMRETLLARLMTALHRSGRCAEAIQVYVDARQRFNEELGVEPGDVMRQEYLRILRHTPS